MKYIKFRAFHKPSKKMFNVGMIDFLANELTGIEDLGNGFSMGHFNKQIKDCELMQFTGLTDCEGKEIFEGDIIQDINDNNSLRYGEDNNLTPVKFYNGSFGISVIFDGSFVPLYPYEEVGFKFKVVGNIHQNSELLEKKSK